MDAFSFLSVVLSLILGLGLTVLLSAALEAFKARHTSRLDWILFFWAFSLFITQIQYW